jgi:hypothetical protein
MHSRVHCLSSVLTLCLLSALLPGTAGAQTYLAQ